VKKRFLALAFAMVAVPAAASAQQVLDLGGGGTFDQAIVPSNEGRASGWFFDNISADQSGAATECNVGFFAVGELDGGCLNQSPGTSANQGGFVGGTGFGSGDGHQPAPFMFSGQYNYNLRLVGSVAGRNSEFGIFTREEDGSYVFTAIPSFGAKAINSTYSVGAGSDWGFYIRNTFNPAGGGCATTADCSNADGGYTGPAFQQFVLMRSATPDGAGGTYRYLVGAEDNRLELMNNAHFWDSDYNDYMVEVGVVVTPEPMSMALMATGLVGLAGASFVQRRRRRNTTS
jgi:hypothetical protein